VSARHKERLLGRPGRAGPHAAARCGWHAAPRAPQRRSRRRRWAGEGEMRFACRLF